MHGHTRRYSYKKKLSKVSFTGSIFVLHTKVYILTLRSYMAKGFPLTRQHCHCFWQTIHTHTHTHTLIDRQQVMRQWSQSAVWVQYVQHTTLYIQGETPTCQYYIHIAKFQLGIRTYSNISAIPYYPTRRALTQGDVMEYYSSTSIIYVFYDIPLFNSVWCHT